MTRLAFVRCEVILCDWQDVKFHLLTNTHPCHPYPTPPSSERGRTNNNAFAANHGKFGTSVVSHSPLWMDSLVCFLSSSYFGFLYHVLRYTLHPTHHSSAWQWSITQGRSLSARGIPRRICGCPRCSSFFYLVPSVKGMCHYSRKQGKAEMWRWYRNFVAEGWLWRCVPYWALSPASFWAS